MTKRSQGFSILLALVPALGTAAAVPTAPTLLDRGYRQMYNMQFAEAHATFRQWQTEHPQDPMGPVSDAAAYLFAEFDRLHILQSEFFTHDQHFVTDHKLTPDPEAKRQFEASLAAAEVLCKRNPANTQFADILRQGLHSDYLALIDKRYMPSLQEMKTARAQAEKLLAADPEAYDAWIAVGVENYMLSVKPAPIRWILRMGGAQTDREFGLQKLRLAAEKGHYLAPFARLLLAVAAMRDKDTNRARELLNGLATEFPLNALYRQELSRLGDSASRSIAR